jgi:hypothetical protein
MPGRARTWTKRIGLGCGLVALAAGAFAAANWQDLQARYVAYRLRTADSDTGRAAAADTLAGLGEAGLPALVGCLR